MLYFHLLLAFFLPDVPDDLTNISALEPKTEIPLQAGLSDGIHFLDNSEIQSLEQLIEALNGKKVYVDVWATWCGPCLQEFEYNPGLQEIAKAQDVNLLYISVDEPRRERQWKEVIAAYNLRGYHIRVNAALERELRALFGKGGGVELPWYMIFDEQGRLAEKHARRPSQGKGLKKQLKRI